MTGPEYFEDVYAASDDPWDLVSAYEQRKYALTVASLPRPSYASGFEPGCSIGVLTELLAQRCDRLLATDGARAPLAEAARRAPTAEVALASVPRDWPAGPFDLVVVSELLYYLPAEDRRRTLERIGDTLSTDGHLVAVHWRHPFEEAECDGDVVHAEVGRFATGARWSRIVEHVEPDFRLEVFERGAT